MKTRGLKHGVMKIDVLAPVFAQFLATLTNVGNPVFFYTLSL